MTTVVVAEIVAAFVDERNGGNLAGVVYDRADLSEAQMQSVAAQLALSETAFLTPFGDGFRFDVFTPTVRVPDCGHATIAAFALLRERGRIAGRTVKHTIGGPRAIRADADGRIFMQQPAPAYETGPDQRRIAASLGLSEATAFAGAPAVARHDVAFLIVPLPQAGMLAAIIPNMRAIEAISATADTLGYAVFAPGEAGVDATIRMFAPRVGIPEESATGMAAGLIAAFLHDRMGRGAQRFRFDQGVFMHPPAPSRLDAALAFASDNATIDEVWVGGRASLRETRLVDV